MIVISLYSLCFHVTIISYDVKKEADPTKIDLCIGIVGLAIFLFIASVNMTLFLIDKENKKIIVKNFVTRRTLEYNFSELDGYCDMTTRHLTKSLSPYFKAIGFVKDKKIIIIIDSYYCSNFNETRNGLETIKYIGADTSWEKFRGRQQRI